MRTTLIAFAVLLLLMEVRRGIFQHAAEKFCIEMWTIVEIVQESLHHQVWKKYFRGTVNTFGVVY